MPIFEPNCSLEEAERLARKYFAEWLTDENEVYCYTRHMRWGVDMAVSRAIIYNDGKRDIMYQHGIPGIAEFRNRLAQIDAVVSTGSATMGEET